VVGELGVAGGPRLVRRITVARAQPGRAAWPL